MEVKPGTRIRVSGPNAPKLLPDVFEIKEFIPPNMVRIENETTGEVIRVHKTRIHKLKSTGIGKTNKESTEPKEKDVAKEKKELEKVDFSKFEGEHWCKDADFDHPEYKQVTNRIIAEDYKSFITFNTYNGSLGKSGKAGTTYPIKKDPEKYRAELTKKGFAKV